MVDLYSLIYTMANILHKGWHNFWHDPQTRHEIDELGLMGLTRLIERIGLWLTYLILYLYLDTTRT